MGKDEDVKVIIFNIYPTEEGYPESTTRLVSMQIEQGYLDDVYRDILADANREPQHRVWDRYFNDGWGDWKEDVRFITKKNETRTR